MRIIVIILILFLTADSCKQDASDYETDLLETGERTPVIDPDISPVIRAEIAEIEVPEASMSPFEKEMANLDSIFYTLVYNQKDTALARKMIHPDFEFYHDRIGVLDNQNEEAASEVMIRRFRDIGDHYRRKLKPGTLESYPLYDGEKLYGALQRGVNQYNEVKSGKPEGTGKFIHLWILEGDQWKLKRAISFDHVAVSQ